MLFCTGRTVKIIDSVKKEDICMGRKGSSYNPIHFHTIPAFFNASGIKFHLPRPHYGRPAPKARKSSRNLFKLKSGI